jgi:predicted nucleic acid-binding protein
VVSVAYFDTSALLKRYVAETASEWVRAYLASADTSAVFTSYLTTVEATCAFARRLRDGTLTVAEHATATQAFDYDIAFRYQLLGIMPITIDTARWLASQHPLRAYDAVQLATAWMLNRDLLDSSDSGITFVCADERLIAVAQAEGLATDNPNDYS